jgi:uncharacterized phage protein (TIGR01671 family)
MTREISFRGLRTDGKGWVEGDLYKGREAMYILLKKAPCESEKHGLPFSPVEVHPHTVGQFTGLLDKNGVKVFEGDIVKGENFLFPCYDNRPLTVEFCLIEQAFTTRVMNKNDIQIIGNIHEPEAQP